MTEDDGNTRWNDELPADGDYQIKVFSSGGAQNYTLTVSISAALKTSAKFTTSGYFDGVEMTSEESGDYGGNSVFLTESDGTWYAFITVSEGVLKRPVLVEAAVKPGKDNAADEIEFTLPGENGGRKFKGKITKTGMNLSEGGNKMVLKEKCYK